MKERLEEKLEERIELILNKKVEDMTAEDFMILTKKLDDIKFSENQVQKNKVLIEIIDKMFID